MDYSAERSLEAILRRRGRLPIGEALELGGQIARALEAAHRQGVIYQSLPAAHILVSAEGQVQLAPAAEGEKAPGVGASYLSPEQAGGGAVDGRADLYSFGVVLFEVVTGQVPFGGESAIEVALQHQFAAPPPLRGLRPEAPPALEELVSRCLAKRPGDRFQSAAELAQALEGLRQCWLVGPAPSPGPAPAPGPAPPLAEGIERAPERATPAPPAAQPPPQPGAEPSPLGTLVTPTGHRLVLRGELTVVGRQDPRSGVYPQVDLAPFDPQRTISRTHAHILRRPEGYILVVLKTTNPTRLNEEVLREGERRLLRDGDRLRFGAVELTFWARQ